MKQLKDYLHLYLGCEYIHNTFGTRGVIGVTKLRSYNSVKPILRPLSDMTEEEEHEAYSIRGKNSFYEFEGETIKYLLSKHFDLFRLIEAGLAIDKTTIKEETSENL